MTPSDPSQTPDIGGLLESALDRDAGTAAFIFRTFPDGVARDEILTRKDIHSRALALAGLMQAQGAVPGDRVIIIADQSPDNIPAIFACALAGLVFTLLPAPDSPGRLDRLRSVIRAARPRLLIGGSRGTDDLREAVSLPVLSVPRNLKGLPPGRRHRSRPEDLACLQFTSGSTADPKGVMLTHGNLLHNIRTLSRYVEPDLVRECVVTWVPFFHNVGLVGSVLYSTFKACPCVVLQAAAFMEKPLRLFEAVGEFGGTSTSGPNSAWMYCATSIPADVLAGRDLSGLSTIATGGEATEETMINAFAERFGGTGLGKHSFKPGYGLSECTSMVSGHMPGGEPRVLRVNGELFSRNRLEEVTAGDTGCRPVVSTGTICDDWQVRIIDPESGGVCGPDRIGEIWVQSASVAAGYWEKPEETAATFGATLPGESGHYLRTGDLGVLRDGQLYVTGRMKDLILINGKNFYSRDIEIPVRREVDPLPLDVMVAFSVREEDTERLIVCGEWNPAGGEGRIWPETAAAIRSVIAGHFGFSPREVLFVAPGSLPRTDNGKIRIFGVKQRYEDGSLHSLYRSGDQGAGPETDPGEPLEEGLPRELARLIGAVLRIDEPGADHNLFDYGLDSIQVTGIATRVERDLGYHLPMKVIFQHPTIRALAAWLQSAGDQKNQPVEKQPDRPFYPVPPWVERMHITQQLDEAELANNMPQALGLQGHLDPQEFCRAVRRVIGRHESLRTAFPVRDGEVVQVVDAGAGERFTMGFTSLKGLSEEEARAQARELIAAFPRPFDLSRAPLLRMDLLEVRDGRFILLLDIHHIVSDGTSLEILKDEILAARAGEPLPDQDWQYKDFSWWQMEFLGSAAADRQRRYWLETLGGPLPRLNLPLDYPRPALQSFSRGIHVFTLDGDVGTRIRSYLHGEQLTMSMFLFAAWNLLLHKLTGATDLVVGTLVTGRTRPEFKNLIGLLANVMALRNSIDPGESFAAFIRRVRDRSVDAYENQDYPFDILIDELGYEKDPGRSTMFDTMFVLQNFYTREEEARQYNLKEWDTPLAGDLMENNLSGLYDLKCRAYEEGEGVSLRLEYCSDLFLPETAAAFGRLYTSLVEAVLRHPETLIRDIPAVPAERRVLLQQPFGTLPAVMGGD